MQAKKYNTLIFSLSMREQLYKPGYGKYLSQLRREAGMSQIELANILGVSQSNIAFWENSNKPPRAELLAPMAKALNVTIEDLLHVKPIKPKRPEVRGKLAKAFSKASHLSRRQQEKIAGVVEALVAQHQ